MSTCPLPRIGVVRSPYTDRRQTPVQSSLNRLEEAVIEIEDGYAAGLAGLDGFTHAWLITWLGAASGDGESGPVEMVQTPFLLRPTGQQVGVFGMRGPRRPNPIGLSLVRVVGVDATTVRFAGVDVVDGTPVLDLKPYVRQFDEPVGEVRNGWFDHTPLPERATPGGLTPAGDEPGPGGS